ncbi:GNAT family N-acetyltransferase [Alsobacter soli]|uniref:GNAT family N-acetyltransferase n=1 Tax=Alsobacter soli TaxID=2109933 RepID=A0A2T1HMD1_9HYPH|nr:GNAT family N-acetyltransferase [Alsobacter soli]PSC02815.1 GNAT family N-acetyltransferase [Alsobacter soli]
MSADGQELVIREARSGDLPAIVRLHEADAAIGQGDVWSDQSRPAYEQAFAEIDRHPDHVLYVAEQGGEVVGTLLLSFMPGLTGRGARHAVLRAVQVSADRRSGGIGAQMVAVAEAEAARRGASLCELMSNMRRVDAHRFYERLGYARSHYGFKKRLR